VVIAAYVGAAGGWSLYARLDGAVTSYGALVSESERKTVEHLEGGILRRLLVRPGQTVTAGEVVAELDPTQAIELLEQLEAERVATAFDLWRLDAEQAGGAAPDPAASPAAPPALAAAQAAAQLRLFEARRSAHARQTDALLRQIEQHEAQIAASAGRSGAARRQLALLTEERAMIASLVAKGAAPRQRLMEFDRAVAEAEGDLTEHSHLMEAARAQIATARAEIERLDQARLVEIATAANEGRRTLATLDSRIRAAGDVRERHLLRATQTGRVVDIRVVTPGAVLGPGQPLLEITPGDDRLLARIRLSPDAIDTVHVGRTARVRLVAYRSAVAPEIPGAVEFVSPDLLEDPRTGETYFEARVALDPEAVARRPDVTPVAGMPVEVVVATGERRAGDYLLEPILGHMRRAFREE
jgi:HlyD family secretion protein